jgi:fimbrial isopeptide formation D2 family protein
VPARSSSRLQVDRLEERLALAAIPTATVNGGAGTLIGQEIPLTVTFDNTATDPADIGYSPFVDIVMPATGDAPPTPDDGISFKPGSATYNGLSLTTTVLTFDTAGKATHPFAKNPDGTALIVSGKPGDQLVVVRLPFGSYGPDQPAAVINFIGAVSPLAQPNASYPITATGGFQYQTDTAGNPTVNVATIGATTTDPVEPQLFRLKKTSSAPEAETATGPNFQHTYTVSMAVAPGQTVNDLLLADVLPNNIQFVSVNTVTGAGSTTITPVADPSTSTPGGTLSRLFDKIVGTGSDTDAVMTFTYFVPQDDAAGLDVIPLGTGGTAIATNVANATGTWTSANPNFPDPQTVESDPDDANAQHTLTARTVALQKSFVDLTNPGSPRAGDLIEYTLNFQVSDFFALDNFDIADVISDGQAFDATFTPTLTFTQKSQTFTAQAFDPANYASADQANGTTNVTFDVSNQLDLLGLVTDGKLVGAGIPDTGTGSPSTLPDPLPGGPGTTGTIKFRARVLDQYRVTPRPGADVVQGDVMTDEATTAADVLAFSDLSPTASTVSDGSSASFTLVSGQATKSVYAINGAPASGTPVVTAGDAVTFRITYNLPFSSIKDYQITDFLPLPIFAAQALTFAGGSPSSAVPAAGQWSYGPTDTYSTISGITPTNSSSSAANSETWSFGTFQDSLDRSAVTDILFTVTATNRPFADGLLLTNQAEQTERNETGDVLTSNTALAQVQISEPLLGITKGVVSTNNPAGVFHPGTGDLDPPEIAPPGVTFSQPGVPGASFTGTITSTGLADQPITATLSNVLGNDLVKFCIIVENTGSGLHGAFDVTVKDAFNAAKMQIPTNATGLNLRVTDGTGAVLTYAGDLFGSGITLVDPSPTTGSLSPGKQTDGTVIDTGRNIAVITYDLQLLPTVVPADVIPNTATLTNYGSTEGGPNFLPPSGISDETTVAVAVPTALKTLVGTSIVDSFNTNTQAVIGELATFELTIKVPEGTTPDAVVVDTLPAGLAFVQMVGTPVVDAGITVSGSSSTSNPAFTPVVTNNGQKLTFNLGDVVNTNPDRQLHGFTVQYKAVVLNVSSNVAGKTLTNSAKLTWTDHTELPAAKSGPCDGDRAQAHDRQVGDADDRPGERHGDVHDSGHGEPDDRPQREPVGHLPWRDRVCRRLAPEHRRRRARDARDGSRRRRLHGHLYAAHTRPDEHAPIPGEAQARRHCRPGDQQRRHPDLDEPAGQPRPDHAQQSERLRADGLGIDEPRPAQQLQVERLGDRDGRAAHGIEDARHDLDRERVEHGHAGRDRRDGDLHRHDEDPSGPDAGGPAHRRHGIGHGLCPDDHGGQRRSREADRAGAQHRPGADELRLHGHVEPRRHRQHRH